MCRHVPLLPFEESICSGAAAMGGEGKVMEERKCEIMMRQHRKATWDG